MWSNRSRWNADVRLDVYAIFVFELLSGKNYATLLFLLDFNVASELNQYEKHIFKVKDFFRRINESKSKRIQFQKLWPKQLQNFLHITIRYCCSVVHCISYGFIAILRVLFFKLSQLMLEKISYKSHILHYRKLLGKSKVSCFKTMYVSHTNLICVIREFMSSTELLEF